MSLRRDRRHNHQMDLAARARKAWQSIHARNPTIEAEAAQRDLTSECKGAPEIARNPRTTRYTGAELPPGPAQDVIPASAKTTGAKMKSAMPATNGSNPGGLVKMMGNPMPAAATPVMSTSAAPGPTILILGGSLISRCPPVSDALPFSGAGAAKPALRFYADASAATRSVLQRLVRQRHP